jgi:hypothetical protein
VIGGRVFLGARKSVQSHQEKDRDHDFHFCSIQTHLFTVTTKMC